MAAALDFDPLIAAGVGATGDFASHQGLVGPSALSMHRSNRCRRRKSALKGPNISAQGKRMRVKRASAPPWEPNPFGEESPERAKQYPAVPPFLGFEINVFVTLVCFSPYRGSEERFLGAPAPQSNSPDSVGRIGRKLRHRSWDDIILHFSGR